ncbi:MAG: hypothetical protein Cons2KO_11440 [Congregibacter sp.]
MLKTEFVQKSDLGQLFYLFPFFILLVLLEGRDSATFSAYFDVLPVLGRTVPFFIFTILLVSVFIVRGGSLSQRGLRWPHYPEKSTQQVIVRIAFLAFSILVLRILFAAAAEPLTEAFPKTIPNDNPLRDNTALLIGLLPIMWMVVIGEEVLIRGLLMNYLARLFGDSAVAWILAIIVSAIVFGLGHMGKGPGAAMGSGFGGLAYGLGYYFSRKNLLPVILAHCAANTLGFIGAYFG